MSDQRFRVTADPLDPRAVAAIVASADCGAIATFIGIVRDEHGGRRVLWLDYEAFEPLAIKAFARIDEEAGERWPSIAACRYAIERIKQIAPIWKHEHYEGGDVWIEGATADPMDEEVRRMAFAQCS